MELTEKEFLDYQRKFLTAKHLKTSLEMLKQKQEGSLAKRVKDYYQEFVYFHNNSLVDDKSCGILEGQVFMSLEGTLFQAVSFYWHNPKSLANVLFIAPQEYRLSFLRQILALFYKGSCFFISEETNYFRVFVESVIMREMQGISSEQSFLD